MARVATDKTGLTIEEADSVWVTGKCSERGRPSEAADTLELRW